MLSDESSSDSETGRFKCRTKKEDEQKSSKREDNVRSLGRSRPSDDRYRRDLEKSRDERGHRDRYSRDRPRFGRHSPPRRRHSRDRSPYRRSRERERPKPRVESPPRSRAKEHRSGSRDRRQHSKSRSHRSPEPKRDLKEELKRHLKEEIKTTKLPKERTPEIIERKSTDKSSSPDFKGKRSEVHKPTTSVQKKRSRSPIIVKGDSDTEVVQAGSYYSLMPAVVKDKVEESPKAVAKKEKSDESSEIDSSDDERLRAKLLNLEKELHRTRKKKHKKKHKKKKSNKDKEFDVCEPSAVEVSSTTDIEKTAISTEQTETAEVTSTQKNNQKESSEEGEISSGDEDSQEHYEIDPTDLRHKLKRKVKTTESASSNEYCGPALPPHLQSKYKGRSISPDIEGPALPPHLKSKSRNIGPSIPEDMRQVLAEREHDDVKYVSSEEDDGIGPLPTGAEKKWSDAHKRLEERALDIKIKKMDGHSMNNSEVKSREQWMLELPEGKAKYLGLEARSFRAKEAPDMSDRSSWTDTPEEKARKAAGIIKENPEEALQREARARHIASRDDEQEKSVKKHKKKHKREESLLELHQKKIKKKKKKEEKDEKPERRPFSRDVDLQVNKFDDAQKKSIIKKAQELNTRFSRGEAKYL